MIKLLFLAVGIVSGIHIYTYGRWLKQQGNLAGSILAFLFSAAVIILPIYRAVK